MKQIIFRILAILCLILGIIGIALPVMPTTPFLLAALYFAADYPAVKRFIRQRSWLNRYVKAYQNQGGMSNRLKVLTLIMLWISLSVSLFFSTDTFIDLLLWLIGLTMSWYILHLKNR